VIVVFSAFADIALTQSRRLDVVPHPFVGADAGRQLAMDLSRLLFHRLPTSALE
jgi:hypothetical protein